MKRAILLLAALALTACADDRVVVRTETVLPAPPSPDLLVLPPETITAGSGNTKVAIARLSASNKQLREGWKGWLQWWRDAERSAEAAKAGVRP